MRSIVLFAAAAVLATGVVAQTEQDHAAHHPDGAPAVAAKKAPAKAKTATTPKAKAAAPAASGGTGMGMMGGGKDNMKDMHDQMHKPGGMHDQMHGKDGKMMGGQMPATPPAPAASK